MNVFDTISYILIALAALLVLTLLAFAAVRVYNDFSRELLHLNTEIRRTEGEEKTYWKRKKRKLWLSLLPFLRYK